MLVSNATSRLMAWLPIPLQELEPCIISLRARQKQAQAWFSKVELPTRSRSTNRNTPQLAVALISQLRFVGQPGCKTFALLSSCQREMFKFQGFA
jgi:hypothetical protein